MIKEGENPNVITINTMIDGIWKEGKLEDGMKLFFEMSNKNVWPNVVTYSVVIDGLCKEGKLDEGMKLFHEMTNKNICPSVIVKV